MPLKGGATPPPLSGPLNWLNAILSLLQGGANVAAGTVLGGCMEGAQILLGSSKTLARRSPN